MIISIISIFIILAGIAIPEIVFQIYGDEKESLCLLIAIGMIGLGIILLIIDFCLN